jgi:hypothetical protein
MHAFVSTAFPRASAVLAVGPGALPPLSVGPVGAPARLQDGFSAVSRRRGREAGERGAKRAANDAPAHSPAADVDATLNMAPKFARESGG